MHGILVYIDDVNHERKQIRQTHEDFLGRFAEGSEMAYANASCIFDHSKARLRGRQTVFESDVRLRRQSKSKKDDDFQRYLGLSVARKAAPAR